jgi:hypothetical protein
LAAFAPDTNTNNQQQSSSKEGGEKGGMGDGAATTGSSSNDSSQRLLQGMRFAIKDVAPGMMMVMIKIAVQTSNHFFALSVSL